LADLKTLALAERRIIEQLPFGNDPGKEEGILAAYDEIAQEYLTLAEEGDLEALKRASFLWWYSVSEPRHLSGLPEFGSHYSRRIVKVLQSAISAPHDRELETLLAWFYVITDWWFELHAADSIPALQQYVARLRQDDGHLDLSAVDYMRDRGQMTYYFASMSEVGRKAAE